MYNPLILGFDKIYGPITCALREAKRKYGKFPSDYEILSPRKKIEEVDLEESSNKVLNLDLGININKKWFKENPKDNLKRFVYDFFSHWHRDYEREFGINIVPLVNINHESLVKDILSSNFAVLETGLILNVRDFLYENSVMRPEILNSIPENLLLDKAIERLERKLKQESSDKNNDSETNKNNDSETKNLLQ